MKLVLGLFTMLSLSISTQAADFYGCEQLMIEETLEMAGTESGQTEQELRGQAEVETEYFSDTYGTGSMIVSYGTYRYHAFVQVYGDLDDQNPACTISEGPFRVEY